MEVTVGKVLFTSSLLLAVSTWGLPFCAHGVHGTVSSYLRVGLWKYCTKYLTTESWQCQKLGQYTRGCDCSRSSSQSSWGRGRRVEGCSLGGGGGVAMSESKPAPCRMCSNLGIVAHLTFHRLRQFLQLLPFLSLVANNRSPKIFRQISLLYLVRERERERERWV